MCIHIRYPVASFATETQRDVCLMERLCYHSVSIPTSAISGSYRNASIRQYIHYFDV